MLYTSMDYSTKRRPQYYAAILASILVSSFSVYTMQEAWAVTVVNDQFFDFGKRDWGTKTWNGASGTNVIYCKSTSGSNCATQLVDRYNYIKTTTKNTGANGGNGAWASAMQGKDPWGHCEKYDSGAGCTSGGGATNRNGNIYSSTGTYLTPAKRSDGLNYKIGAQYYWFKDSTSKPDSGAVTSGDNTLRGRLMTNLWFVDTVSSKVCTNYWANVVVMDITWVNVKASTESGNKVWAYESITDQDSSVPGKQYNAIFWDKNSNCQSQKQFHFSLVLDSTCAVNYNYWCETTATDIQTYINSALSATYTLSGGSQTATPGGYSNYKLADIETGTEIWTNDGDINGVKNTGTLVGAFSRSQFFY